MAEENDLVIIYLEDKPLAFARIEEILPDSKANWYHVKLLILQLPLQMVTWILRDSYIDGAEFTMEGKKMRMERVASPEDQRAPMARKKEKKTPPKAAGGKVISLADLKRK